MTVRVEVAPPVVGVTELEEKLEVEPDGRPEVLRDMAGGVAEPVASVSVAVYAVDPPLRTVASLGESDTEKS